MNVQSFPQVRPLKELYQLLDEGLDEITDGRTQEFSAAMKEIRKYITNGQARSRHAIP